MRPGNNLIGVAFFFFLNACSFPLLGQAKGEVVIEIPHRLLTVDDLGNIYLVTDRNELRKYNAEGKLLKFFNVVSNGRISSIDVSNPLKILLYYPDFNRVTILDQTLTPTGEIDLLKRGYHQVSAFCNAQDNMYWLYDAAENRVVKIDESLQVVNKSEDITTLLGITFIPQQIIARDNLLLLADSTYGILLCDVFGNYIKTIPLKGISRLQKLDDRLLFINGNKLELYEMNTLLVKEIVYDDIMINLENAGVYRNRLILSNGKEVRVVRLE